MATATLPTPTTTAAAVRTQTRTIKVHIMRQSTPDTLARTEKFEIPYRPCINLTSSLGKSRLPAIIWLSASY